MNNTAKGANHFIKAAAILAIAGLISKVLGAAYKIPYQNITGDIGMHVYGTVYPLYTTLIALATAGFPLAISKMIADRHAVGDSRGVQQIFRISSLTLGILGVVFFLLTFITAPMIANLIGDPNLTNPLRAISVSLVLVPLIANTRGYFQGHQNMLPTAVSQVTEQFFRVIIIIVGAYFVMKLYGDPYFAGTIAVFAATPGAIIALLVLGYFYRKQKRELIALPNQAGEQAVSLSDGAVFKRIITYAIPICLASLVLPLIPLADSFTIINMLVYKGIDNEAAILLKGAFDRSQPLLQFGTFFATSLSLAIVPSISEAIVRKQDDLIHYRTQTAIRLTFLLGAAATIGLAILAKPINIMLFGDENGTLALAINAFAILFSTLGIVSSGILQGMGKVNLPPKYLLIGVLVKFAANLILLPLLGIAGAAIGTVLAYLVSTVLNLRAIGRLTQVTQQDKQKYGRSVLAVVMMGIIVAVVAFGLMAVLPAAIGKGRLLYTIVSLASVGSGVLVYGISLIKFGGVTRDDIQFLPKSGKILALLQKMRLLEKK
ncbi:putative polysaccharide biosynthesis protein [Brevibacillus laterosporus]|uniref:putative polysaccharide biosynthesis protein n=1 Tax=Brevibacillus laterosporus TaxID=1465 RepID=UPI0018CF804F|nr:polysaccharide biosynthesis protein [Brevibacillus laterosporus]MBG9799250.1 membrane protein [Brevibacillus laterosporus]MED1913347.1 polysaccharide biosynthesis protein [Brevibacillus laterosporus]